MHWVTVAPCLRILNLVFIFQQYHSNGREKICDNQLKGAGQVIAKGGQENAFFRSENPKNSHMLDNNVSHWTGPLTGDRGSLHQNGQDSHLRAGLRWSSSSGWQEESSSLLKIVANHESSLLNTYLAFLKKALTIMFSVILLLSLFARVIPCVPKRKSTHLPAVPTPLWDIHAQMPTLAISDCGCSLLFSQIKRGKLNFLTS